MIVHTCGKNGAVKNTDTREARGLRGKRCSRTDGRLNESFTSKYRENLRKSNDTLFLRKTTPIDYIVRLCGGYKFYLSSYSSSKHLILWLFSKFFPRQIYNVFILSRKTQFPFLSAHFRISLEHRLKARLCYLSS